MLKETAKTLTIYNRTQEENLWSAKRALRCYRGAHLHRIINEIDEVIAIVVGEYILEKHICKKVLKRMDGYPKIKHTPIEEWALYQ